MDKQYQPSRRRRERARKEGNIPKSQQLSQAASLTAGIAAVLFYTASSWVDLQILIEYYWTAGVKEPVQVSGIIGTQALYLIAKILLISALVGVGAELFQTGWQFEPGLLAVKFDRISPAAGLKRALENLKRSWIVVLKFFVILLTLGWFFHSILDEIFQLLLLPFGAAVQWFWKVVVRLVAVLSSLLMISALLDLYLNYRKWFDSVGMSLQDLKQEHKEDEGDPHIKAARKQQHMELLQQDLIRRIRSARVIVVERAG